MKGIIMITKQSKFKEIGKVAIATVMAVAIFGGALWGINSRTFLGATSVETSLPQTVEDISIPDPPVPEESQVINLAVSHVTRENVEISPRALSLEDAVHVGTRYILDVFGVDIKGMYLELELVTGTI